MSAPMVCRRASAFRAAANRSGRPQKLIVAAHSTSNTGFAAVVGASIATVASVLRAPIAAALEYELPDAPTIQYQVPVAAPAVAAPAVALPNFTFPDVTLPDITIPSEVESMVAENPLLLAGAGIVVVAAIVASSFLGSGSGKKAISTSAKQAYEALSADERTVLLDVRPKAEIQELGAPDLRALKRKLLSVPYTKVTKGEDGPTTTMVEDFAEKVTQLKGLTAESVLVVLDTDGKLGSKAAAAVLASELGVEKVYYVQGGADAWQAAELPWKKASKFELPDLGSLAENLKLEQIAENYKKNPTLGNLGIAALAFGGATVFAIQEIEVILEAVGVYAAGVLLAKNLLFAEDRERAFSQLKSLFQDKIAAGEIGSNLRQLANTVLASDTADAAVANLQKQQVEEAPAAAVAAPAETTTAAATTTTTPPPSPATTSEVPPNVAEAREWIAAWRRQQLEAALPAEEKVLETVNA